LIYGGRVDLRLGSVANLPFASDTVDMAVAINSMQVWPDPSASLGKLRRVTKPGDRIALGFTAKAAQDAEDAMELIRSAGFDEPDVVRRRKDFCILVPT
jgi:ubiquinone/menaquinone biosynthesis C-methylase UbiE